MEPAGYNDSIFINCPFDPEYTQILQAIVFAIYRCGFFPKTAQDNDDGTENRLSKIISIIKKCKYGIHDISRTEVNSEGFPRFNMPFELGIFFGARFLGSSEQKKKNALIFEKTRYSYLQVISDLNGIDPKAHNNNPLLAIKKISEWLTDTSLRKTIPGHLIIVREYKSFRKKLPSIVQKLGLDPDDIPFRNYTLIVEEAVRGESK